MARGAVSTPVLVLRATQRNSRDETPGAGWAHTSGVEAEARQSGQKDRDARAGPEAWPQLLRLQEPCAERRQRQARADPALYGDRCRRARQPGAGWAVDEGNTCNDVFADSAYPSPRSRPNFRAKWSTTVGFLDAVGNHPLFLAQYSEPRRAGYARIEHVSGAQQNARGGRSQIRKKGDTHMVPRRPQKSYVPSRRAPDIEHR